MHTHNSTHTHTSRTSTHMRTCHAFTAVQIRRRTHQRVHTDTLRSGVTVRRGRYISERGRCVNCLAHAPMPDTGRKSKLSNGKWIPYVTYACDVCRVHLCRACFPVYHHHKGGKPAESVTLR